MKKEVWLKKNRKLKQKWITPKDNFTLNTCPWCTGEIEINGKTFDIELHNFISYGVESFKLTLKERKDEEELF